MKKFIAILLLGLYGFSVSGASVQLHYCCGEVSEISVGYAQNETCDHEEEYSMPGCCFDQQVYMDVDSDQGSATTPTLTVPSLMACLPEFSWVALAPVLPAIAPNVEPRGSPPLHHAIPLYIRNQVFRN